MWYKKCPLDCTFLQTLIVALCMYAYLHQWDLHMYTCHIPEHTLLFCNFYRAGNAQGGIVWDFPRFKYCCGREDKPFELLCVHLYTPAMQAV